MPGIFGIVCIVIVALYIINSIKILAEYERGVIFDLDVSWKRQGTWHHPGVRAH